MSNNTANLGNLSVRIAVSYRDPKSLHPYPGNPRTHSKAQVRKIARNIEQFGFLVPLLVDRKDVVIAGHARLVAALRLQLPEVPVVRIDHLTPTEVRALRLADNRLAEEADWDHIRLREEFEALVIDPVEIDLSFTGFEVAEIDRILVVDDMKDEEEPVLTRKPAVTRLGDLWILGEHRVLCGSALRLEDYDILMGEERAALVLSDPPYNVPVQGHVSGLGATRHAEFAMASGEMTKEQFTAFLASFMREARRYSRMGALLMCFMDWRHMGEVVAAGEASYDGQLINMVVWVKTNAGMGSLYRSRHELLFVFKSGKAPHVNNVALGRHGRYRSNVWTYKGQNSFGNNRDKALADHPTPKPLRLLEDAILDVTRQGDIVLDPFGGSGSTMLAAERARRRARLIELDPVYVDVSLRRYAEITGKEARLAATGETFQEVEARRAQEDLDPQQASEVLQPVSSDHSLPEDDDEAA